MQHQSLEAVATTMLASQGDKVLQSHGTAAMLALVGCDTRPIGPGVYDVNSTDKEGCTVLHRYSSPHCSQLLHTRLCILLNLQTLRASVARLQPSTIQKSMASLVMCGSHVSNNVYGSHVSSPCILSCSCCSCMIDNLMMCIMQAGKVGLVNLPVSTHSQLWHPA